MIEPGQGERHEESELASDLATAVDRARTLVATPEMVERLTANVLAKTQQAKGISHVDGKRARGSVGVFWLCAIAASIGSIVMIRTWKTTSEDRGDAPAMELMTVPLYSPITSVAYTAIGYRQIEVDLDRADRLVESVSEGLALASIRHEIQVTLDEFYDWSK